MDIPSDKTLLYIMVALAPMIASIFGWFVKKTAEKTEDILEKLHELVDTHAIAVRMLERDIAEIMKDLGAFSEEVKNLRKLYEEVIIMKRDMSAMWRRIDEQKEDIKRLELEIKKA